MPYATGADNSILITGTETIATLFADAVNTGWLVRQGHSGFYSYYNDERRLIVQNGADFTISACTYTSLVNNSTTDTERRQMLRIESGGVLNLGEQQTINSETLASEFRTHINLWSTDNWNNQSWQPNSSILFVDGDGTTGGICNMYGVTLNYLEGQIRAENRGRFNIRNSRIFTQSTLSALAEVARIVIAGASDGSTLNENLRGVLDVDGLEIGSRGEMEVNIMGDVAQLKRYFPRHSKLPLHSTSGGGASFIVEDADGEGNTTDITVQNNGAGGVAAGEYPYIQSINHAKGNNVIYSTKGLTVGTSQNGSGLIEGKIDVTVNVVDDTGAAVENGLVYYRDADNGDRNNALTGTGPHPTSGIDYDVDQEYQTATDASGNATSRVLINVYDRRTNSNPTTALPTDIRSPLVGRFGVYGKRRFELPITSDRSYTQPILLAQSAETAVDEATALAYTGISISEGTFNLFGKTFSIKITAIGRTAQEINDFINAQINRDGTFGGQNAGYWHELIIPGFETTAGTSDSSGTIRGVCVVDGSDAAIPGFTRFQADDESYYDLPLATDVSITLNAATSSVLVVDDAGVTQFYSASETGAFNYTIPGTATGSWTFVTKAPGYAPATFTKAADGDTAAFSGITPLDRQPDGTLMYQNTTSGLFAAGAISDGSRLNLDISNGAVSAQNVYDEVEDELLTQDGMEYLYNGGGRVSLAVLPGGNHLFMETNVRLRRATAPDVNAQLDAFALSTDNVVVDGVNGGVLFLSVTDADKVSAHLGSVWVDLASPNSGTNFPTGTQFKPVNNLTDALNIASGLGLVQINLLSDITINVDAQNYRFVAPSAVRTVTLSVGNVTGATFEGLRLAGSQLGTGVSAFRCYLDGLTNASLAADRCVLDVGGLSVADGGEVLLFNCASAVPGTSKPWISLVGATGVSLMLRKWSGGVEVRESTDVGNNISMDLVAGSPEIASSSTDGTIILRGSGNPLVDNSTNGLVVVSTGYNAANAAGSVWDGQMETGHTYGNALRLMSAVMAGKTIVTGLGGGVNRVAYRDLADTKARVTADVDEDGQRTNTIYDGA